MDSILDTISNVPAASSSRELSWRLTTVDKLDRLSLSGPSATADFSTEPSQGNIIEEIVDQLYYFQSPTDQRLRAKLMEITSMTIKLWRALRKDNCRIVFDYEPSTGDRQEWDFVDYVTTNGFTAANSRSEIPVTQLPSKPFMLFPRITGSFECDGARPRILHAGSALRHDSPAFQEGLQEIKHNDDAIRELKCNLRRGSSAQSSPVSGKPQGDWRLLHRGND